MKRILLSIAACCFCVSSFALTETEGVSYIINYYKLLTDYATAENVSLAKTIEKMHVESGHVYPDIEINLGKLPENEWVSIRTYLVSIVSDENRNLLLKFVPTGISLEGSNSGITTMAYTLSVYSGNEQPDREVLKYSVPLKMEIQNGEKIRIISKGAKSSLSVSPSNVSFDASGGTRTLTITSNTSWSISVNTASWRHLTRSGNTLTLRVDANTESTERTDYFKIKAGDKEERINIKQAGYANFSVSSDNLSFNSSGGSQTITVCTSGTWEIGTNTNSWGHLSKNGNQLTVRIDPNPNEESRTDWFSIKSGGKEKRINISQASSSKSATINTINVYNNSDIDGEKGLSIKVSFKVSGMKGKSGLMSCYFYDSDGNALIDSNNRYGTDETTSHVAVSKSICPGYETSEYTDYEVKIPYSELHQSGTYSRTLKVMVIIWDNSVTPHKQIQRSSYTSFSYTPSVESYLKVDNSTSDKFKNFSESGGRETYYVSTSESSYETWGVPTWCSIESKTSTSFTLVCDPNTSSSERSDYMKIKAGGKEIRIDIKQEGKSSSAEVENCWLTHNLYKTMWNGFMWVNVSYMQIHCHFSVEGHKGEKVRVCAFFYFSNGNRVNAVNNEFRTSDGQATVQGTGNCSYDNTEWKDYTLEIPYYALPKGSLYVEVQIHDKNGNYLAESSDISFSVM